MNFGIVCFVLLFCVPMGCIIASLPPSSLTRVGEETGLAVLLFVAALLLPRLLRRVRLRRDRVPSARELAGLAWPRSLRRSEIEGYCMAWLHSRGWSVAFATDPEKDAEAVFIMASRGDATVAVLCDRRGEELNPATVRAFAAAASELGATHHAVLTLYRGRLPPPTQVAARRAGVKLLRVADLPQLDALLPPAPQPAEPLPVPVPG